MLIRFASGILCLTCAASLLLSSCDRFSEDASRGQLLAEVGEQKLYINDVKGVVPPGLTNTDSVQVLLDFVARWVRDAAVSEEAILKIGDRPDIERLVEQYRTSLARDRYKASVAAQRIDTSISQQELQQIYENSKAGLSAKQALIRAVLIKMPSPVPNEENFEESWQAFDDPDQWVTCQQMAKQHASLAFLDINKWYTASEIQALLPNSAPSSIRVGSSVAKGDGHVYYFRVIELVNVGETTPLPYVRERLSKIILEQRKSAFLGNYTEEIYQEARTQNRVKIYIGNDQ